MRTSLKWIEAADTDMSRPNFELIDTISKAQYKNFLPSRLTFHQTEQARLAAKGVTWGHS